MTTNHVGSKKMAIETEPKFEDVRLLEDLIYDFNVQATGISDARLLSVIQRDGNERTIGGVFGWTWGGTCYIRYLFVPPHLRRQGRGLSLMQAVETEARARGCTQIVLETHSFQAPEFYRKLGFEITGCVDGYPRGHRYFTMVKRLAS